MIQEKKKNWSADSFASLQTSLSVLRLHRTLNNTCIQLFPPLRKREREKKEIKKERLREREREKERKIKKIDRIKQKQKEKERERRREKEREHLRTPIAYNDSMLFLLKMSSSIM
jgi:hypothetical protein